jgi:hypothetical protein
LDVEEERIGRQFSITSSASSARPSTHDFDFEVRLEQALQFVAHPPVIVRDQRFHEEEPGSRLRQ